MDVKPANQLLPTLGLFVAIAAAFAVSLWGDRLTDSEPAAVVAPLSSCDLNQGPCRSALADGRAVTLALAPTPLLPMQPLQARVTLEGLDTVNRATLRFTGLDMDMGINRFPLTAGALPHQLSGEAMLPICSRSTMLWEAVVELAVGDARIQFPFRFATRRP